MLRQLLEFDRIMIASVDVPRGLFTPLHISGDFIADWDIGPVRRLDNTLTGKAVLSSTPVISHKLEGADASICKTSGDVWRSGLGMRIVNSGQIIGAITFRSHEANAFGPDESLAAEHISRIIAPYLNQHSLREEVQRATEHQTNLEHLLRLLNDRQDPSTFFNSFYSVFSARTALVFGALFSFDRYFDRYVPIAHIDSSEDGGSLILDRATELVNNGRLTSDAVILACEHKSVPVSEPGAGLRRMVSESPVFKELCLIPLTADTNRVGAIFFGMSDCTPSMLERVQEINSAGPIASAFLRLHQTSRFWDRQQHVATVLQHAVDGLCDASTFRQKLSVFEDFLLDSLGATEYRIEITHRVTETASFSRERTAKRSNYRRVRSSSPETLRVVSPLRDTHIVEVSAVFDPDTSGLHAHHELRSVVRVCAQILAAAVLDEPERAAVPAFGNGTHAVGVQPGAIETYGLSDRETQILRLLSHGATNDEIAEHFRLASGTVKNRLVSIYKKLGVRNRSEASRAALLLDGEL